MTAPKVGDKCWVWNINSRVYGANRKIVTRGHFREEVITGETPTSWIVGDRKFRKDDRWIRDKNWSSHQRLFLTESDVDDYCFREDHAYAIAEMVRKADAQTLHMVARTIGYVVESRP